MLQPRVAAKLGSVPSYLILTLIFPAVLSLLLITDALAAGPRKRTSMHLLDVDSVEKTFNEEFLLRRLVKPDFSIGFPRNAGNTSRSSLNFEEQPDEKRLLFPVYGEKLLPPLASERILPGDNGKISSLPFSASLAAGTIYSFGSEDRDSRLTMDFFLPAQLDNSTTLFLESRAECQDLFTRLLSSTYQRFDLGFGLGWRKVWDNGVMVGANVLLDTSRFAGDWYSSPGFGFEFPSHSFGGLWEVVLNFYRGGGIDLEGRFTFPIWEDRFDMRIYVEKYRFFDGEFILGSKGGVEISSPDRFVTVSYAYGQDSRDPAYHAVACSLTIPFSPEKIFSGKNPFEMPTIPSRDTRYTKRLKSEGVKRAWRSPDSVVEARHTPQGKRWSTPGKLSNSFFWSGNPTTQTAKAAKEEPTPPPKSKDFRCSEEAGKTGSDIRLVGSLLNWFLGTGPGAAICLGAATYIGGNYAYRNAFGPFEIEPHELERIKKEMPKKKRRK
jgi:hypothetical protein